jgi:hypothetical protein
MTILINIQRPRKSLETYIPDKWRPVTCREQHAEDDPETNLRSRNRPSGFMLQAEEEAVKKSNWSVTDKNVILNFLKAEGFSVYFHNISLD